MSLHVAFERCPLSNIRCQVCKKRIDRSTLCIKKRSVDGSKYYHMSCYEPPEEQIIDLHRHARLQKYVKEDWEIVKQWVEQWNSLLRVCVETLPAQFVAKAVGTTSSPLRRLLLETFQYLEMREIEQLVAFVCKEWFHVTRDNEFWKTQYLTSFQPSNICGTDNYRSKFIVIYQNCCWLCHTLISLNEIKLICPVHKRPLCRHCFKTDNGHIVTLNSYFTSRKISSTLVARLDFRHFIYDKFKQNYLSALGDTMLPYAEQRKHSLLSALQMLCPSKISIAELNAIASCDLWDFYKSRYPSSYKRAMWSLSVFCGLDDEKEDFQENVLYFLSLLKRYGCYY